MPLKQSAKKAHRQELKRRARNLWYKKRIKEIQIRIKKFLQENKPEEAKNSLPLFYKFVDKAVKVGVLKKNKASRMKSRMTKFINSKI